METVIDSVKLFPGNGEENRNKLIIFGNFDAVLKQ